MEHGRHREVELVWCGVGSIQPASGTPDAELCGQDSRLNVPSGIPVSLWDPRLVDLSMTLVFVPARSLVGDPASTGPQARDPVSRQ